MPVNRTGFEMAVNVELGKLGELVEFGRRLTQFNQFNQFPLLSSFIFVTELLGIRF